ncbi:hypothetical protein FRC09_006134 [Ceratobasidium sp. 395]|nr:hypothetical protein FRC09_006134 [Ceratobasidium sp. 395]
MVFAPRVEIGKDGARRYHNVDSGDYWNLRQRTLPLGTTFAPVIVMSDTAPLTQFTGDVQAHGVFMSLANIDKSVREDINNGAWLLIGIIPKSNWDKTLAHMPKMSDAERGSVIATMLN